MSAPVKVILGLAGLSAIAIPGAWMAISAEPSSQTIDNFSATEQKYKDKFGEDFKHHLVDAREGRNKNWWDWAFRYRWQADVDAEREQNFKGVTDGESLGKKCEEIYQKARKNLENNKKSVWRYCSLEGQKPITLSESVEDKDNTDTDTFKASKKNDLVSTKDARNSKFWEIQEKAFFMEGGLGSQVKEDGSIFKKLYEDKKGSLKESCQKVYEKKETDASKDKQEALLFCSLSIKES